MRRVLAGLTALALAAGTLAAGSPAQSAPVPVAPAPAAAAPQAAPFAPLADLPKLEAFEREQRANGNEARALAAAKKVDDEQAKGNKGWQGEKGKIRPRPQQGKTAGQGGGAMLPCASPCYFYNSFHQFLSADPAEGTTSIITVGKPFTDAPNWTHSLGEISVHSQDQQDVVEVGWTVDKAQRADGNPILFAFHWVDGVPKGYGTGFVDYTDNAATPGVVEGAINLGAGLPKPVNKKFLISQTSTAWWVYYDTDYVAYVPKSRWTPGGVVRPFNNVNAGIYLTQHFFELAATETEPCSDMGTGTPWNATGTPTPPVATITNYANAGTATTPSFTVGSTNPPDAVWGAALTSATSGTGGGPGYDPDGNDTAPAVGAPAVC